MSAESRSEMQLRRAAYTIDNMTCSTGNWHEKTRLVRLEVQTMPATTSKRGEQFFVGAERQSISFLGRVLSSTSTTGRCLMAMFQVRLRVESNCTDEILSGLP